MATLPCALSLRLLLCHRGAHRGALLGVVPPFCRPLQKALRSLEILLLQAPRVHALYVGARGPPVASC